MREIFAASCSESDSLRGSDLFDGWCSSSMRKRQRPTSLCRSDAEDAEIRETRSKFRIVVAGYLVTILLSIVFPIAAVIVYLGIALYFLVPSDTVIRKLSEIRGRRVS
jgi:hypothetical protein